MSFEFRAGRKRVVKSVETVEEANKLMRKMIGAGVQVDSVVTDPPY